jgi:hypothetical protein
LLRAPILVVALPWQRIQPIEVIAYLRQRHAKFQSGFDRFDSFCGSARVLENQFGDFVSHAWRIQAIG